MFIYMTLYIIPKGKLKMKHFQLFIKLVLVFRQIMNINNHALEGYTG